MPQRTRNTASSSRWTRWRQLSPFERRATIAAAGVIPLVAVSLRVFGMNRTIGWVGRGRQRAADQDDAAVSRALGHAVMRAGRRGIYKGNCLSQSVTLIRLLARHGIVGELRFGARTTGARLEAHAWVECEGRVLNDRADVESQFAVLARDPARPA